MRFLIWVLVNALALAAATWIMGGITVTADTTSGRVLTLAVVAVVFGVVNAIVRPIATRCPSPDHLDARADDLRRQRPDAALTSWLSGKLDLGFHVDGFWTALGGAFVITVATWLLGLVLREDR